MANTATTYYIDSDAVKKACENDFKKIDEECKTEPKKPGEIRHPAMKKILGAKRVEKLEEMAQKIKNKETKSKKKFESKDDNAWMSHCDGLWVKPNQVGEELKEFNKMLKDMSDDVEKAIKEQIEPFIKEASIEAVKNKMIGKGAKDVAKKGAKKFVPFVGWVLTGYDAAQAALAVKQIKSLKDLAQGAVSELKSLGDNLQNKTPTDLMADGMGVLSRLNACTRARRCLLVPFNQTTTAGSMDGKGCCPGQTGHHVIPEESGGSCDKYSHDGAPTMCVEGTNNGNGTHGRAHDKLVDLVKQHKKGEGWGILPAVPTNTATYKEMREMGIESVQQTFPESRCDEKCLRAQLDAYYKDKCKKDMPAAAGKKSKRDEDL
jgi:hypothetical protein